MRMKTIIPTLLIACSLLFLPSIADAQFEDPDPVDPTSVPFDGGLSLLIAAGVGYASKKAYNKRQKEKMQEESKN